MNKALEDKFSKGTSTLEDILDEDGVKGQLSTPSEAAMSLYDFVNVQFH